jgi:hypothetical protein
MNNMFLIDVRRKCYIIYTYIMIIKTYIEITDNDYEEYNNIWKDNINRCIYLSIEMSKSKRYKYLLQDIKSDCTKDILAIRHHDNIAIKKIINEFKDGVQYDIDKIWYPSEIWIYITRGSILK